MTITAGALRDINLGQGGTYGKSRDVLKHNIWDQHYLGTTISSYTYFSQGIGASWRSGTKTVVETNLSDSGRLPSSQTFLVKAIGVKLIVPLAAAETTSEDVVQAYVNLMQSSVFEITVKGREFDYQIHGSQFLPNIMVNAAAAASTFTNRVGDMVSGGWSKLADTPIFLEPLATFNVKQTLANPDSNVTTILNANSSLLSGKYGQIQVILAGTLTRGK